jgi:hypothetical protein
MKRKLLLIAIAMGAAWLYEYVLVMTFAYLPTFVLTADILRATGRMGGHWLLQASGLGLDLLITGAVSIPFAVVITMLYERRWLFVATVVACWALLPKIAGAPTVWREVADHGAYVATPMMTTVRLLLTLPLLTSLCKSMACSGLGDRRSAIGSIIP